MNKSALLVNINRLKLCFILVCVLLFVFLGYSCLHGFFPTTYPDSAGQVFIKLDHAYYQIWGSSVQVYASFSELYDEKPEVFEGDFYVLLVSTKKKPITSFYNKTKTLKFRWRNENGSYIYHNSTISVETTPIRDAVTVGENMIFNITINVEEDLLFEFFPSDPYESIPRFQFREGLNVLSIEISFLEGDASAVLMSYAFCFENEEFNFTESRAYGFQAVFGFSFFTNITGEVHEQRYFVGDRIGHAVWILPFSADILDEQYIEVEKGLLFGSFPLSTSLSADKIVFAKSAGYESYIIHVNPLIVFLSPPISLPTIVSLVLLYLIYTRWQRMISNLLRFKFFYGSMLIAIALISLRYLQVFSGRFSDAILFLIPSVICLGIVSIGVKKNNFRQDQYWRFWKNMALLMVLISLYPIAIYVYHAVSRGDLELFVLLPPVMSVVMLLFLGACLVGMIVNTCISFAAGFFLAITHLGLRFWYRIRHRPEPSPITLEAHKGTTPYVVKPFSYYISEFFLFSLWFLILISSTVSVSIEQLVETVWDTNLLLALIPLSAPVHLLLLYELLSVVWVEEIDGGEVKKLGPKLLHRFWSAFSAIVFVAKILWTGFSLSILQGIFVLSFNMLIISSGFALGFIGTNQIGFRHALREIRRTAKRYAEILVLQ